MLTIVALGALFQAQGNLGVSLVATGLVAVLFQPLRGRLQRGVNRLMYGERDDPYAVISRLGKRFEAALAPETVLPTIVGIVRRRSSCPTPPSRPQDGNDFEIVAASGEEPPADPLVLPLLRGRVRRRTPARTACAGRKLFRCRPAPPGRPGGPRGCSGAWGARDGRP